MEATASGTVTDDEGAPIEAATVTFAQSELGIDTSTTTGTGGAYTLTLGEVARRHLGAFDMEATAAAEGYESATATPTLEESISQDFTLVSLTQSGVITFSVYNLFGDQTPETRGTTFTVRSDVEETSQMASGDEISLTIDYQDPELRIWHDHGANNTYNDILILREMNQPGPAIDHNNIANNGMTENWTHGQSFDTLRVNLNDLSKTYRTT